MDAYHGTLLVLNGDTSPTYVFGSNSVLNTRSVISKRWLDSIWEGQPALRASLGPGMLYMQFDDYNHTTLKSVAYGRRVGSDPIVKLVPDAYFYESGGYQSTREAALAGRLPRWADRRPKLFWRGSSTHDLRRLDGGFIERPDQIPRVAACLRLQASPHADVGLETWLLGAHPAPSLVDAFIRNHRLRGPKVPMKEHARYKLGLDIDGMANAWGFVDKLLMGSCLLKVASPYEQWFYGDLRPWVHYVPVRADLSDLEERIDWCLANDDAAEAIGRAGQTLSLRHTYAHATECACEAIRQAFIAW